MLLIVASVLLTAEGDDRLRKRLARSICLADTKVSLRHAPLQRAALGRELGLAASEPESIQQQFARLEVVEGCVARLREIVHCLAERVGRVSRVRPMV